MHLRKHNLLNLESHGIQQQKPISDSIAVSQEQECEATQIGQLKITRQCVDIPSSIENTKTSLSGINNQDTVKAIFFPIVIFDEKIN